MTTAVNVKAGESVLHYATMVSSTEIVDLLTAMGATDEINALLQGATVGGNRDLVSRYLKRGADPNAQDASGWSARRYAESEHGSQIVELLSESVTNR